MHEESNTYDASDARGKFDCLDFDGSHIEVVPEYDSPDCDGPDFDGPDCDREPFSFSFLLAMFPDLHDCDHQQAPVQHPF